jgi:hypothetical protein
MNPLWKWTGLWERTSTRGTRYLTGRIAGLKLVILPNPDSGADPDAPTHFAYLTEPTERSGDTQRPITRPTHRVRNAYQHLRPAADRPSNDGRPFDDELPPQLR